MPPADGTVRGTFELNTPATARLREMRGEAKLTREEFGRLGSTMDRRVGGRVAEQRLERYSKRLGDMRRTSTRTHDSMRMEWTATTRHVHREVGKQTKRIDHLEARMVELSKRKATPTVDVDGIARAISQVELLHRQLNALGRQRVTPRLAMGGGFGGGGGGGFGGGGRGGGASGRLRDFRIMGIGVKGLAAGATLGLPGIQALGGAAVAGGGSLGLAGLGAGALGTAGLAGAGVGGLGLLASGKGTLTVLKDVTTAQKAYNKAVAQYGENSKQAQTAEEKWRNMLRNEPPEIRAVSREMAALSKEWRKANAPGRAAFADILTTGLSTARQLTPTAARASNRVTRATAREARGFGRFAAGPTGRSLINTGAGIYDENLRSLRITGQNVVETFTNITRASRPFFREGTTFLRHWTGGWARGTRDVGKTRKEIGRMVEHLKAWLRLGRSAGRLFGDIFNRGADAGKSGVERLTDQLDRWDEWIRRNPRKVEAFFDRAIDSTAKLGSALAQIAKVLSNLATLLTPVLDRFSQLTTLAGSLGLLTPGVGALAFGAYRGLRGGGAGAAAAGGGGAGAALALGAGAGAAGAGRLGGRVRAGNARLMYGLGRESGMGRAASARAGAGELFAGGRMRGLGAVRGAGRAYLPIAALFAGLDAYSFPGTGLERGQAALSSASLGFVPRPQTGDQLRDKGYGAAAKFLSGGARPPNSRAIQRQMQHVIGAPVYGNEFAGEAGLRAAARQQNDSKSRNEARRRLAELEELRRAYDQTREAEDKFARGREREKARSSILDLGKSFDVLRRKMSPGRALASWSKGWMEEFKKAGPAGKRQLGRSGAQWIEQMRRTGQITTSQAARANKRIVREFADMGQRVKVINGRVYTGSAAEWKNIEDSLSTHAEQARQRVTREFTRLQRMAIHSLEAYGYTPSEAKRLVAAKEKGLKAEQTTSQAISIAHGDRPADRARGGRLRAGGGRLVGRNPKDLSDNIRLANGDIGAHDELVVNRHTERRVNSILSRHNTTLGGEVGRETRKHGHSERSTVHGRRRKPHTDVYARGGRAMRGLAAGLQGANAALSGSVNLMGANPGLMPYAVLGRQYGLRVSSGARPGAITSSGNRSLHASANAIDVAGPASGMLAYARMMASHYGRGLEELIHTPLGFGIKNGRRVPPYAAADHYDHVHVGDVDPSGRLAPGLGSALAGAGGAMGITLKARRSGLRGIPGAIADRASQMLAAGMEQSVNRRIGGTMPGGGGRAAGGQYDKSALAQLWIQAGGPRGVAGLMAAVALAESRGNPRARNPSGASGLWQILGLPFPGDPFDPLTNARMAVSKYGSQGLRAWEAYTNGNYRQFMARGGRLSSRGSMDWAGFRRAGGAFTTRSGRAAGFVAGEGGQREDVFIRPHRGRKRSALASSAAGGGGGRGVTVNVIFRAPVSVATKGDLDALTDSVAEKVGEKVRDALAAGDEVPDTVIG